MVLKYQWYFLVESYLKFLQVMYITGLNTADFVYNCKSIHFLHWHFYNSNLFSEHCRLTEWQTSTSLESLKIVRTPMYYTPAVFPCLLYIPIHHNLPYVGTSDLPI